jgi:pyrophosphate--fructose-6-phosphate 1-phosphotransferase
MMDCEVRHGKNVPVITKALTELDSPCFLAYAKMREMWSLHDCFVSPGPIQFAGVDENALTYLIRPPTDADLESVVDEECK